MTDESVPSMSFTIRAPGNPEDTRALPEDVFHDAASYYIAWLNAFALPDIGNEDPDDQARHLAFLEWTKMLDTVLTRWAHELQVGSSQVNMHPVSATWLLCDHLVALGGLIRAAGNMYAHPKHLATTFDGAIAEFVHTSLVLARAMEDDFSARYQADPLDWQHKWVDIHGWRMHSIAKQVRIAQAVRAGDAAALQQLDQDGVVEAMHNQSAEKLAQADTTDPAEYGPGVLDPWDIRALPAPARLALARSDLQGALDALSEAIEAQDTPNPALDPKRRRALDALERLMLVWTSLDRAHECWQDKLPMGWFVSGSGHPLGGGVFLPRWFEQASPFSDEGTHALMSPPDNAMEHVVTMIPRDTTSVVASVYREAENQVLVIDSLGNGRRFKASYAAEPEAPN